ncbi:MAG TPA: decaprenyl-phosphate phosphoribosyltransferase [Acidimicrobiia bacterium]|nr:decaprenyl-phosphate phosphoribosyltransferase [Acidimicrobiia bacterium]
MSDADLSTETPPVVESAAVVDTPVPTPASAAAPGRPALPSGPDRWKYTIPGGLLRASRPRQWIKNVLVFAAPGAAGLSLTVDNVAPVIGAFVAWCLVSSGTYLVNDASDAEADRLHPRKRLRAVASGVVSVNVARVVGLSLLVVGAGAPALWGAPRMTGLLALYAAITLSYSLWLKEIAIIDLAAVASGFVLRAISGGVAADVPISDWFLIVASFGSLFIVAGKRHAEHVDLREGRGAHRATLEEYSLGFLGYVRSVASGVTILAYCLWAFEKADVANAPVLFQLSIIPFVLAILRYALLLDAGRGGAPEDIVIGDRPLQLLGLFWVGLFAAGVYAA